MYKYIVSGLTLASLLNLTPAFAGDCTTHFTQECLATRYNGAQVEHEQNRRMEDITATGEAMEAQARAEEERNALAAERQQRGEQQRAYEAEKEKRAEKLRKRLEELREESDDEEFLSRRSRRVRY